MTADNDNRKPDCTVFQAEFGRRLAAGMTRKSALYAAIKGLIVSGRLAYSVRLPPSRVLAQRLRLSRDTVEISYSQLEAEGYIIRNVGRGSMVSYHRQSLIGQELLTKTLPTAVEPPLPLSNYGNALIQTPLPRPAGRQETLAPSLPDLRHFPINDWLQLERQALRQDAERFLGYAEPQGMAELRSEIADYLQRERGVKASAEQVLVVSSSQQALSLCTQVLFNPGDNVFVEEPGYQGAKKLVQAAGLTVRPVTVDEAGMNIEALSRQDVMARGVFITPSHHYPLGYSLSIERRLALLAWAQRQQAWIIEDDYDSEFNYIGVATAALQGLDRHQRTLYIGTFSKTLFPGLRIGFIIVPPALIAPMTAAKRLQDGYTSPLAQVTLYKFIKGGFYTEHLRNMRQLYKARLEILHRAVHQHLGQWTAPLLPEGGLQLVCPLANAQTERRLVQAAAQQGVRLSGLADFSTAPPVAGALILGFAAYQPEEIRQFIKRLAVIFAACADA